MTTCHHDGADDMPAFLCRRCHPELTLTPEARQKADDADRKALAQKIEKDRQARECMDAQRRIESMTARGEPESGSVNATVLAALRAKVRRLSA